MDTHAYHPFPRREPGRDEQLGRAIRTARYRLVEWKGFGAPPDSATFELYDSTTDPHETRNRASDHPEVVTALRALVAQHPEAKLPVYRRPRP